MCRRLEVAVIPTVVQTHRFALRLARIREPLAIVWDMRRTLPRYVEDPRETLAAHMRERRGTKVR
jgi:hypothetical protein